jgi:hypothetical protein
MQGTTGMFTTMFIGVFVLTCNHRYTYSLVFAADMYATVFKKDPLNPLLGQRYRDEILRVGGSREEIESLEVCSSLHLSNTLLIGPLLGFPGSTAEFRGVLEGVVRHCACFEPLSRERSGQYSAFWALTKFDIRRNLI